MQRCILLLIKVPISKNRIFKKKKFQTFKKITQGIFHARLLIKSLKKKYGFNLISRPCRLYPKFSFSIFLFVL